MTAANSRVLIIVENLPVPFDRRVWLEATTLRDAGYQVAVICPTGKMATERRAVVDDIAIYRHPLYEAKHTLGYLWEYSFALVWELMLARVAIRRMGGVDIVQVCNPPDLLFLVAKIVALLTGASIVFDHHDLGPELYEARTGRKGIFHGLLKLLERATFSVADVVISTNQSYRQIALDRGGKLPERVFVVRSGPNLDRFRPVRPNDHLKRGRPFAVGYVGVMGPQEGLDYLLRAVHYIVFDRGRTDIIFLLIGDGPSRPGLQELADELGISCHVQFTGRLSDNELIEHLATADVCVNPDRWSSFNDKSTMNKIMEYMALAKPIVQFDLREGRASAEGASVYARLDDEVDFAEKILFLIDSPEERRAMGVEGLKRMTDQLEWKHQAPVLLEACGLAHRLARGSASSE
jgi:glycosyltransferase involved in cell wall biosynthesis